MDQESFKAGFDKLVDGVLYLSPVNTLIFQHHAVDRKAAIHLKIENGLCLFKGQEAALHQACDEIFFAHIGKFLQHPRGNNIIRKEYLIMR